jgi:hypothetical protein
MFALRRAPRQRAVLRLPVANRPQVAFDFERVGVSTSFEKMRAR